MKLGTDMNENSRLVFQALLKNALWGTQVDNFCKPTEAQWKQIVRTARMQTVSALIADAILRHEALWNLPESFKKELQMTAIVTVRENMRLNAILAKTTDLLRQNDIRSVLLKGQGVALNYPNPDLRCCGDIDLYVGTEDYAKACKLLIAKADNFDDTTETNKHLHITWSGVPIELHRVAEEMEGKRFNRYFQAATLDALERAEIPSHTFHDVPVLLPPDSFNAFYIFEHIWHHFLNGGIGLRQLCDWVMFLHTHYKKINLNVLRVHLKELGLWYPWLVFAPIAVEHLGLPANECPFYNVLYSGDALRIMRLIYREGNFGKFNPALQHKHKEYALRKLASFRLHTGRFILLGRIFPLEVTRRYRYFLGNSFNRVATEMKHKKPDAPRTVKKSDLN